MCGIMGMIASQDSVVPYLLEGLETLEYRGYDSAGVCSLDQQQHIQIAKTTKRVAQLRKMCEHWQQSSVGIAHTRWATHGAVTIDNAHPHFDQSGRFYLVHNGVIENAQALKETYLSEYTFTSETDTEVIVQLISYFVFQEKRSVDQAIKEVSRKLIGSFACVLMDQESPSELWVIKQKSPLWIGLGDEFHLISSDRLGLGNHVSKAIRLPDEVYGKITANDYQFVNYISAKPIELPIETLAPIAEEEAHDYNDFMSKEIHEQGKVIKRLLSKNWQEIIDHWQNNPEFLKWLSSDRIYIIACGTSWHAGLLVQRFFETLTNIPVEVHIASEFAYYPPQLSSSPGFIFISQSGETADSRNVLKKVTEQGYVSFSLTNNETSTLAQEASFTLCLDAGIERSVASTKAYTAQVVTMFILACYFGQLLGYDHPWMRDYHQVLSSIADHIDHISKHKDQIQQLSETLLKDQDSLFLLGRGRDYDTAQEGALKIKEIAYLYAEGYPAGELKHGPIALIEEGTPVIGICTEKYTVDQLMSNLVEVASRGAHVWMIADERYVIDAPFPIFSMPCEDHPLDSLTALVILQWLAYYTAQARGYDVDYPRNLAKSVTVE